MQKLLTKKIEFELNDETGKGKNQQKKDKNEKRFET